MWIIRLPQDILLSFLLLNWRKDACSRRRRRSDGGNFPGEIAGIFIFATTQSTITFRGLVFRSAPPTNGHCQNVTKKCCSAYKSFIRTNLAVWRRAFLPLSLVRGYWTKKVWNTTGNKSGIAVKSSSGILGIRGKSMTPTAIQKREGKNILLVQGCPNKHLRQKTCWTFFGKKIWQAKGLPPSLLLPLSRRAINSGRFGKSIKAVFGGRRRRRLRPRGLKRAKKGIWRQLLACSSKDRHSILCCRGREGREVANYFDTRGKWNGLFTPLFWPAVGSCDPLSYHVQCCGLGFWLVLKSSHKRGFFL